MGTFTENSELFRMITAVSMILLGGVLAWLWRAVTTLVPRVAVLEAQRGELVQRLERIENKLDRIMLRAKDETIRTSGG
jgi:hypothetical protein